MPVRAVMDNGRVKYAFQQMPHVFAEEIDHWLNRERMKFIGTKKKNYTFGIKGKLYHTETEAGKEGWPANFVEQLASFKDNPKTLSARMTMGLLSNNKRLVSAMELFEKGGVINTGKFMPVPNLEALKYYGAYNQKQAYEFFKDSMGKRGFTLMRGANGNYYVTSTGSDVAEHRLEKHGPLSGNRMLLFTLSKKAKIKKQFDFTKRWAKRIPAVMLRGEQAIFRATRKIERILKESGRM